MKNHSDTSENLNEHNKDTQKQRFYEYFKTNTATVYQFEKATRISCANGCRYKAELVDSGLIKVVKIGRCPISDEKGVQFLSSNKSKFPAVQLSIPFNQPNQ